jgi:hypothetical protein
MTVLRVILLAAVLSSLGACGAVMHGGRQNIDVQTSPAGARVETTPETGVFTTPTTLNLERKNSYVLTFTSPGYSPATFNLHNSIGTGTLIADVLLTGLIGVIVDAATGSWYGLSPENATATLTRVTGTGPETITIKLATAHGSGKVTLSSNAAGVLVEVAKK